MNVVQFRLLELLELDSTRAKQTYAPLFVQSRCPTRLIDDGRTSRIGGDAGTGVGVTTGCGTGVGVGDGEGVGLGFGVGVGDGVGTRVGVSVGVGCFACTGVVEPVEPQDARTTTSMAIQRTLFLSVLLSDCKRRATGPEIL